MGGRIDCYVDLSSVFSYVAFLDLQRNRSLFEAHGVKVEFHPFFLGAVNNKTGNKPPVSLPAKAMYGLFDVRRAMQRVGNPPYQIPDDFFAHAMTVLPLRCLHYIKRNYSQEVFETTLGYLFHLNFAPPNVNLTQPPAMTKALSQVPAGFSSLSLAQVGKPLFKPADVEAILKGGTSQELKDALKNTTQEGLERGAFGAPWLWVTGPQGETEPFFGSDRFHFIYRFLGLPHLDITLLPPGQDGESKSKL